MRIYFDGPNYIDMEKVGRREVRIRACDGIMLIKPESSNMVKIKLLGWLEYNMEKEGEDET